MCGIVGYIGKEEAAPILLDGLSKLEYRGYDSAGVAVFTGKELKVIKSKGRLKLLSDMLDGGRALPGTVGLGHTRWATHGEPSDLNAHPHLSHSGKIAVVHNGIIENYMRLKEMLLAKGVTFRSDTDTEVVAQLLDYFYEGDILKAVAKTVDRLEGSYALGIVCSDCPDRLVAARKDAPLILGYGKSCNFMASDVTAVIRYTKDVCYLDDGEIAVLKEGEITVYNSILTPVEKQRSRVDWEISAAEKGGYEHFMFKEIMEQPKAVRDTLSPRIKNGRVVFENLSLTEEYVRSLNRILIVACGSSYHVGMNAKYIMEKLLRKPVEVVLASEFRYCDPIVDESSLVIVISQSGETADTLAALREAKRRGARTLAVVNVVGSSIAKEANDVIYTWAGPEIAVATTKAYSTQLVILYLITLRFGELLGTIAPEEYDAIVAELQRIPSKIEEILEHREKIQYYASIYFNNSSIFFIGRNLDYAICMEGSLKLKEISYIHSEAYAAGELKHGTISLIEDGTLVVAMANHGRLFDKMVSNIKEVKARGADVLGLTGAKHARALEQVADNVISIPETHEILMPSLAVIPLQLFSYYVALQRGCDIDKPRNLAKSVTVE
ncbi:glutamine--fructose-6-phosphate transaminase (isomerizing) [Papillibacter cinnamivorans]|uniref:Glutamine--fructose-6-phosphate aminotransferase [isomerizing] n=1 Tax=Papillibacter cinnamivorans DSM 12816 TaxID=1122930 RepID=A0A1W2CKW1_9FIRM|nr:glutamine--fructose-6-phosphate transaminase (isomerizing) [Papillibacter cinnamivorans]SMC85843.1 glucosamine--fructose-6-phosphate aminotransferase (isomerizing) [Papillibacter cinnamivorans DSM 12816]